MKRVNLLMFVTLFILSACRKDDAAYVATTNNASKNGTASSLYSQMRMASAGPFSQYVPLDSANRMINSYLTSINYPANDSDLRALIVNADSLRHYLSDPRVKQLKLMLAHTQQYMNAGKYGVPAGNQTGALTIVIVGFDENNNYIYGPGNTVLDHTQPCPDWCPTSGTAQYSILVQ